MMHSFLGICLTACLAACAHWIETLPLWPFTIEGPSPHPIDAMILAILLGIATKTAFPGIKQWKRGISIAPRVLLPLGIAFMGARFDYSVLLTVSAHALLINVFCVLFAFQCTLWLAKVAGVSPKTATLVGIGTAICGGTAIVAAAPVIRAKDTDTSLSIAAISLFGLLAIAVYPVIGTISGMSELQFGVWAGTAIQAIPQVIAAGFAFSVPAGETALLVKLVRILLLGPFILYLSIREGRRHPLTQGSWLRFIPPFVYGFVAIAALSTTGLLDPIAIAGTMVAGKTILTKISSFLICMAMVAIGVETDLRSLLHTQGKVLLTAFMAAILLGGVSYWLILAFV